MPTIIDESAGILPSPEGQFGIGRDEIGESFARIRSILDNGGISPKAFLKTLPEARERVFERHYGPAAKGPTNSRRRGSDKRK